MEKKLEKNWKKIGKIWFFYQNIFQTKLTSIIATKKNKSEIVNQLQRPFRNESLGQVDGLNIDENAALEEGLERCKTLADFALPRGLKLLVDAEYTYMNDGISVVALAMMKHYNISEAKIGNTYQCYLKQALNTITEELEIVTANGQAKFGAKIVRGAYLEKERKLAQSQGYPDPVNDTYQATGEMYQKVIGFLLERSNGYTVIATHNEDAVGKIAQKLRNNEEKRQGKFVFAQIYGMGEQITMPLGKTKNVAKFSYYKVLFQLMMDSRCTNLCLMDLWRKSYPTCHVGYRKIAQFCRVLARNEICLYLNCAEEFWINPAFCSFENKANFIFHLLWVLLIFELS